jgi:adenosine deaminase
MQRVCPLSRPLDAKSSIIYSNVRYSVKKHDKHQEKSRHFDFVNLTFLVLFRTLSFISQLLLLFFVLMELLLFTPNYYDFSDAFDFQNPR